MLKVYVAHRFKFKELWPQLVSYLHNNNGSDDGLFNKNTLIPDSEIQENYSNGLITTDKYEKYCLIKEMYSNGSFNFIAFEYFRSMAQQYNLEVFIQMDSSYNSENVDYVDIGLGLGLGLNSNNNTKTKNKESDKINLLCSGEVAVSQIDYILRSSIFLNELPFWSYCITKESGPQIFYINDCVSGSELY